MGALIQHIILSIPLVLASTGYAAHQTTGMRVEYRDSGECVRNSNTERGVTKKVR